jgi:hypothetical protein
MSLLLQGSSRQMMTGDERPIKDRKRGRGHSDFRRHSTPIRLALEPKYSPSRPNIRPASRFYTLVPKRVTSRHKKPHTSSARNLHMYKCSRTTAILARPLFDNLVNPG